jgi:hypothetical protein
LTAPAISSPLLLSMGIRDREVLGWVQAKAPVFLALALKPILTSKAATADDQMARARRVGRDPRGVSDYGHSIRLTAMHDYDGRLLRPADVEISATGDLTNPNRIVRRARRADSLALLKRIGTISDLDLIACERLRDDLERSGRSLPAGTLPATRSPPWGRSGVNSEQLIAMAAVRDAMANVAARDRPALLWIVAGGGINGFVRLTGRRRQAVTGSIVAACAALVDHYDRIGQ